MPAFISSYSSQCYALMRIVVGFLFLFHGAQKLFGFPSPLPPGVPAFVTYVFGPIELVGGFLVMVGFLARWAAFLGFLLMAAAYWMVHGTRALLPIQNGGELSALYGFVFLFISAHGSGIFSLDAALGRR